MFQHLGPLEIGGSPMRNTSATAFFQAKSSHSSGLRRAWGLMAILAACLGLGPASSAPAQETLTLYWDTNGTTAGSGTNDRQQATRPSARTGRGERAGGRPPRVQIFSVAEAGWLALRFRWGRVKGLFSTWGRQP